MEYRCAVTFDFHDDPDQREREAKRQTSLEIVDYVTNARTRSNEALMKGTVSVTGTNISRTPQTR